MGNTEGSEFPEVRQLAWLAGILDGEGCFTIFRQHNIRRKDGTTYDYTSAGITITNTCNSLLTECRRILEALDIKYQYLQPRNSTTRPVYRIAVQNYSAILQLLDNVQRFIIGKAEQAALMREFVERAKVRKGFDSLEERAEYRAKMSDLNKYGQLIL